jgi:hypothetical protein
MSNNLTTASREWATRPDDQRFLSLADLKASVQRRRRESWTATPATADLRVIPHDHDELAIEVYDPTQGTRRELKPTNWSFSQMAGYAQAPASYLRKLPAELAAINLQWGLEKAPQRDDALVLAQSNGSNYLRAMTSTSYGRIWDIEVVEAVEKVNQDGRWQVPAASYATTNSKRATTLYASDRDVFIFLVDPARPVEVNGETLFRGFYTWNSEVGSATFGLCTFLYRYVCDNRIIWGATDVKEVRIRHTGGAPERFAYEGARYLRRYADEATGRLVEGIKAAQAKDLTAEINTGKGDTVADWLQRRGFTKAQAKGAVDAATAEEGRARTLWDIVNGVTAYARTVSHTDERVDLEAKAGRLMALVA